MTENWCFLLIVITKKGCFDPSAGSITFTKGFGRDSEYIYLAETDQIAFETDLGIKSNIPYVYSDMQIKPNRVMHSSGDNKVAFSSMVMHVDRPLKSIEQI